MSIWRKKHTKEELNKGSEGSMVAHLGMELTEMGPDYLVGTMPVDERTIQPFGLLHGGASAAFAETLGSIGANLVCAIDSYCVGLEVNANHLRKATSGIVIGRASPIHLGRKVQVWNIKISNEEQKLVCVARLTLAVIPKEDKVPFPEYLT